MSKFKLGNKPFSRDFKNKGVELKITRKNLPEGTHGEAVSKNEIIIDKDIKKGSKFYNEVVAHEAHHAKEMASGRISYGDDYVRSDGKTYPRKDGYIKYNGQWLPEGDKSFPWEQRAEAAESRPFAKIFGSESDAATEAGLGEKRADIKGADIARTVAFGGVGAAYSLYKRFKDRQREKRLREGFEDSGIDAYEPL
tara:strand:+ start:1264 stop:1851 length:588 start_codon:yes stop_codon:yes gene_type:complete